MKNSKQLFQDFVSQITLDDEVSEIEAMAYLVLDHLFMLTPTDILSGRKIEVTASATSKIGEVIHRINLHEPVQYILGEADFFGRKFKVNSSVLIPRPETEELVRAILNSVKKPELKTFTILDIGTGSGCIPIILKLELPESKVFATDISEKALAVASANAKSLHANVSFILNDILKGEVPIKNADIVVSNPPYVKRGEQVTMKKNVVAYEPALALFVPDDDALIFYRAIASKAKRILTADGLLAVEINERFGAEVSDIFKSDGYENVQILKDMQGKERIVMGFK